MGDEYQSAGRSVGETDGRRIGYDPEKRLYYGKNVPEEEKDNVWVFDVFHSETKDYVGYAATGVGADDYKPNYILDIDRDNIGYACCMGNYGVTNRYHLTVTNSGSQTRYFDYKLFTGASVIVKVTDENGNLLQPTLTKGQTIEQTEDIMTSIELPAGESRSFSSSSFTLQYSLICPIEENITAKGFPSLPFSFRIFSTL